MAIEKKRKRSNSDAKPKEQIKPEVRKPVQSSLLKADEAFPRGGGSTLTPLEYKEVTKEAKRDALFEESSSSSKSQSKKRRRGGEKVQTTKTREGPKIEGLSFKRLKSGTIILGQIIAVSRTELTIALPNNLVGFVSIAHVSKQLAHDLARADDSAVEADDENALVTSLKELFSHHQWLRVSVVSVNKGQVGKGKKERRSIELSIEPSLANVGLTKDTIAIKSTVQASIESIEDHGVIVDIGVDGLKGFIKSKNIPSGTVYKRGQVILCVASSSGDNGKVVQLTPDFASTPRKIKLKSVLNIAAVLPGDGVEVVVSQAHDTSFTGKVGGLLDATCDVFQADLARIPRKLEEGQKLFARCLYVDETTEPRKIGISLLPHVLDFSQSSTKNDSLEDPSKAIPVGFKFDQVVVKHVESKYGLFCDIGLENMQGFAHISRLSETKIDALESTDGKYKVNSQHAARVVGHSPVDGLVMLSLEPGVIESDFLTAADAKVGSIVQGKIGKFVDGGFLVILSPTVTGFVPEAHFADIKLQYPEKKFKEGSSIKCRVLNSNLAHNKLTLTAKKSLINTDDAIITSYNDLSIGMKSTGVISKLFDNGALIQFYGGVHGFLPIAEMSEAYIADAKEHFKLGQALAIRVLSFDSENRKLSVSCRDPAVWTETKLEDFSNVKIGSVVSGTIIDKVKDRLVVLIKPGDYNATIEVGHLSDGDLKKCDKLLERARVGGHIKEAVVLTKSDSHKQLSLSAKPSLLSAAKSGTLLSKFEDVTVGKSVCGFVRKVTDYGVLVGFANGLTALALKHNLSDVYIPSPAAVFQPSQSVTCRATEIDAERERFQVSFRKASEEAPPVKVAADSGDSLSLGQILEAVITSVKETQLNIQIMTDNHTFRGRIDISSIYDRFSDIQNTDRPLKAFSSQQKLNVKIIGLHDARNYKYLPLTHKTSNTKLVYECSIKPSDLKAKNVAIMGFEDLQEGALHTAFVNNSSTDCLWVNLSPLVRGRINFLDLAQEVTSENDVEEHYPIGAAIQCRITHFAAATKHLDLSEKAVSSKQITAISDVHLNDKLPAKITKVTSSGILAQLSPTVSGRISLTDIWADYKDNPTEGFSKNQLVQVNVKDIDIPNKKIALSLRDGPGHDAEVNSINDLKVGGNYRGYIKNVATTGLFVELGRTVVGRVKIAETSDDFIKDWQALFSVDQLVSGTVLAIDHKTGRVEFSLKKHVKLDQGKVGLSDLKVGQVIEGTVKKIETFGIFIQVNSASATSGLCHRSEVADHPIKDLSTAYSVGDLVKAKILDIQLDKRRISFGLKSSYFTNLEDGDEVSDAFEQFEDEDADMLSSEYEDDESNDGADFDGEDDLENADSDAEQSDEEMNEPEAQDIDEPAFDWTAESVFEPLKAGSDSETEVQEPVKKSKKSKKSYDDTAIDFDSKTPDTVSDFERLILGDPDSSDTWIRYMAFHMQSSETDKARDVAERALSTINYRRESEKANIWVALLNLENNFGTDESLEKVFKRSCEYMEPKEMYSRLVGSYIRAGKLDKADALYQDMLKKFSHSPQTYPEYAKFLIDNDKIDAARDLLPRALQTLPKSEHISIMQKFAQIEFQLGDPERGRTLFEGLLSNFPKRLDIWNVLIDMETQQSNFTGVRQIFDRIISTKLSEKKAKSVFKKWLKFESEHGSEDDQEAVKLRATEYVSLHFR